MSASEQAKKRLEDIVHTFGLPRTIELLEELCAEADTSLRDGYNLALEADKWKYSGLVLKEGRLKIQRQTASKLT